MPVARRTNPGHGHPVRLRGAHGISHADGELEVTSRTVSVLARIATSVQTSAKCMCLFIDKKKKKKKTVEMLELVARDGRSSDNGKVRVFTCRTEISRSVSCFSYLRTSSLKIYVFVVVKIKKKLSNIKLSSTTKLHQLELDNQHRRFHSTHLFGLSVAGADGRLSVHICPRQ